MDDGRPVVTTAPLASSTATPLRREPVVVAARGRSAFAPILLFALALVGWLGFQAVQQVNERQQLAALTASLDPQEQAATKLRAALDAIAGATARLAASGDPSARLVVDELRRRGVTINPNQSPSPAPAPKPQ